MTDIILKRFSLDSAKTDWITWLAVSIIWLLVLACTISSICKQFPAGKQRVSWIMVAVCLPVFGLLWYLPFSFKREDYPFLFSSNK